MNIRNPKIAQRQPMSLEALRGFAVNRAGQHEVIWQPTYDRLDYPIAGATSLTFFQQPVGQAGRTLADTNIRSAGQFPRPQEFLVTGLQVVLYPSGDFLENNLKVLNNGWLELFIGSKPYLQDAPVGKFSSTFTFDGVTNVAADEYIRNVGRYYSITPVLIPANQNFNVSLNWPTAVPLESETTAKIQVILDGYLYRLSQ